jgi:thioredoxin 1
LNTVLYFTAEWCNPCKRTRPLVEELNKDQSETRFYIIDVDIEMEMASDFNIKSVPTFVVINNNQEIHRTTGAKTKVQLEELINYGDQ